jgi:hypothetical protein
MSKVIQKDEITKQTKSQTFRLGPMQDLNQMQWQLEDKSDMMLEKECSCTFFEIFSLRQFIPLFDSYSNGRIQALATKGRRSQAHLKWAWNGNGL